MQDTKMAKVIEGEIENDCSIPADLRTARILKEVSDTICLSSHQSDSLTVVQIMGISIYYLSKLDGKANKDGLKNTSLKQ